MAKWRLQDYLNDVTDMSDRMGERTVVFFDAVMAIAITLLILEIGIPVADDFGLEEVEELFVPITAFFISFNMLGKLWLVHVRAFSLPRASDVCSPQMHIPLMILVVLFPKTTELIAAYPHSPLAVAIYLGCALLLMAFMFVTIRLMLGKLMDRYRRAFAMSSEIKVSRTGIKTAIGDYSKKNPAFAALLDSLGSAVNAEIMSMAIELVSAVGATIFLFINPWICYAFFIVDIVCSIVLQRRSTDARQHIAESWHELPELQERVDKGLQG